MASADDHRRAQVRCVIRGENASSEEARRTWLSLAETYEVLLTIDREIESGPIIGSRPT